MSILETFNPASLAQSDAKTTRAPLLVPSRNKPARLATRTKWSLSYMLDLQKTAREQMAIILHWTQEERTEARSRVHLSRLERLSDLEHAVALLALCNAETERAIHDCLAGQYNGPAIPGGAA